MEGETQKNFEHSVPVRKHAGPRISITFRHVAPSDLIRKHAEDKLSKLQRFLRQPMIAKMTLSLEKLEHAVEVRVSSGSEHFEAHVHSADMYQSIDKVVHKLERQIAESKAAEQSRQRRSGETLRDGRGLTDPVVVRALNPVDAAAE